MRSHTIRSIPFQPKVPTFRSVREAILSFPKIAGMDTDIYKSEIMLIDLINGVIYGIYTEATAPIKTYTCYATLGVCYIGIMSAGQYSNGTAAVRLKAIQRFDSMTSAYIITQPISPSFNSDIIHRTIYDINRICATSSKMVLIDTRKPASRFFG